MGQYTKANGKMTSDGAKVSKSGEKDQSTSEAGVKILPVEKDV